MHHLATFPSQCSLILESIAHDKITIRHNNKWSILEHLGHLLDLDELPSRRIAEILAGKEVLSSADLQNKNTWDNDYNNQNMYTIGERFMQSRKELVELFHSVPENKWLAKSFHERLNRHLSILDLAYFQGQHDQYHREMMLHLAST